MTDDRLQFTNASFGIIEPLIFGLHSRPGSESLPSFNKGLLGFGFTLPDMRPLHVPRTGGRLDGDIKGVYRFGIERPKGKNFRRENFLQFSLVIPLMVDVEQAGPRDKAFITRAELLEHFIKAAK